MDITACTSNKQCHGAVMVSRSIFALHIGFVEMMAYFSKSKKKNVKITTLKYLC